jgi:hypothetical protein
MITRDHLRAATQIALIRKLQLDRRRVETVRAVACADDAYAAERAAQDRLDEQSQALRRAVQNGLSLPLELMSNLGASIEGSRRVLELKRSESVRAAQCAEHERLGYFRQRQLSDMADAIVSDTARAYLRSSETRQADALEDSRHARSTST